MIDALTVRDLTSGYGSSAVCRDIELTLAKGEILGIIGQNGAGKTTLLKSLTGIIRAWRGAIRLGERDVSADTTDERARKGLGYVPQGRGIFSGLTVHENLLMGKLIHAPKSGPNLDRAFEYFPILHARRKQKAGTMSGGEQQMLAIGRMLVGDPSVLLLDEPSEGVQPSLVDGMCESIRRVVADSGLAVLVVEQNVEVISTLSRRALVIELGRVTRELSTQEVKNEELLSALIAP